MKSKNTVKKSTYIGIDYDKRYNLTRLSAVVELWKSFVIIISLHGPVNIISYSIRKAGDKKKIVFFLETELSYFPGVWNEIAC